MLEDKNEKGSLVGGFGAAEAALLCFWWCWGVDVVWGASPKRAKRSADIVGERWMVARLQIYSYLVLCWCIQRQSGHATMAAVLWRCWRGMVMLAAVFGSSPVGIESASGQAWQGCCRGISWWGGWISWSPRRRLAWAPGSPRRVIVSLFPPQPLPTGASIVVFKDFGFTGRYGIGVPLPK